MGGGITRQLFHLESSLISSFPPFFEKILSSNDVSDLQFTARYTLFDDYILLSERSAVKFIYYFCFFFRFLPMHFPFGENLKEKDSPSPRGEHVEEKCSP